MKKFLMLLMLVMYTLSIGGCELSFKRDIRSFKYIGIKDTELKVNIDLSKEEWIINQYNGQNLFKKDDEIYFKEYYRLYKINGMNSKLISKMEYPGEAYLFENEIYYNENYIANEPFSKYNYRTNKFDIKEDNEVIYYTRTTANDMTELLMVGYPDSSRIVSKYEDRYYYIKSSISNEIKIEELYEYDSLTKKHTFIKTIGPNAEIVRVFNDEKHIIILESFLISDDNWFDAAFVSVYSSENYQNIFCELEFATYWRTDHGSFRLNYFNNILYLFEYKNENVIQVHMLNLDTAQIDVQKYIYEWETYSGLPVPFCANIFDNKYYYIVQSHKVSRIDRTTGLVELVYEVVE